MKFNNIPTLENIGQSEIEELQFIDTECPETDLADGEIDFIEQGSDIENLDEGFDIAEKAVDSIDEVKSVINEDITSGASKLELSTVECLLNSIHTNLGTERQTISLEHYSIMSKSELIDTLESEKQGIMSRLASGIISLINTIIGFVASLFRNRTLLLRYIDNLKTRVNEYVDGNGLDKVPAKFKDFSGVQEAYKACTELVKVGNSYIERLDSFKDAIKDGIPDKFKPNKTADHAELSKSQFAGGEKVEAGNSEKMTSFKFVAGEITEGARLNKSEMNRTLDIAKSTVDLLKTLKSTESRLVAVGRILKDALIGTYHGVKANRSFNNKNNQHGLEHGVKAMLRILAIEYRGTAVFFGYKSPAVIFKNAKAMADYVKSSLVTR